ncbi:hypothetical protein DICPUDRAFT_74489 [Dictyostelium purpureum]|uniref:Uncharacterized protein n=1 Tax=Dictyostelium purpureum TaxID=5786 RepID=F0Z7W4_DICPU|nr:uncharacterized protein DICPUDRAFT_74489 [Dictyostelium purpureum]EGC39976.1 hypothetical protein DICPUDRAFT_74489 [Dictyostelium purpureum]|eukprot:XP_003283479.1 hypothetical protein DICPUDRAFT_74489 [Dictyostelium purpureum]
MDDVISLFNKNFKFDNNNNNNNNNNSSNNTNINSNNNDCIKSIETLISSLNNNKFNISSYKSSEIKTLFALLKSLPFNKNEEYDGTIPSGNNNNYNNSNNIEDGGDIIFEQKEEYSDTDYRLFSTIRREGIELIFQIIPIVLENSFHYDSSLITPILLSCCSTNNDSPISFKLIIAQNMNKLFYNFLIFQKSNYKYLLPYMHDIIQYILYSLKNTMNLKIHIEVLNLFEMICNYNDIITNIDFFNFYLKNIYQALLEGIIIKQSPDKGDQGQKEFIYDQILEPENELSIIRSKCLNILNIVSNLKIDHKNNLIQLLLEIYNSDNNNSNNSNNTSEFNETSKKELLSKCLNEIKYFDNNREESLKLLFEVYFINKDNNTPIEWIYFSSILDGFSVYYYEQFKINNTSSEPKYFNNIFNRMDQLITISNPVFQISVLNFIETLIKINILPIYTVVSMYIKVSKYTAPQYRDKIQIETLASLTKQLVILLNKENGNLCDEKQYETKVLNEVWSILISNFKNVSNTFLKYDYLKIFSILVISSPDERNQSDPILYDLFNTILSELNFLIAEYENFATNKYKTKPILNCLDFLNNTLGFVSNRIDLNLDRNINRLLILGMDSFNDEIEFQVLRLLSNKFQCHLIQCPFIDTDQLKTLMQKIYKLLIDKRIFINYYAHIALSNLINSMYAPQIQQYIQEILQQISNYYLETFFNSSSNQIYQNFKLNYTLINYYINNTKSTISQHNNHQQKDFDILKNFKIIISITFSRLLLNCDYYNTFVLKLFSNIFDSWCSNINDVENENDEKDQAVILLLDLIYSDPNLMCFNPNQAYNLRKTIHKWCNFTFDNSNNNNNILKSINFKLNQSSTKLVNSSPAIKNKFKNLKNLNLCENFL